MEYHFYKHKDTDKIWWANTFKKGLIVFSFDKKKLFNIYKDYPHKLTKEQIKIFREENPLLASHLES